MITALLFALCIVSSGLEGNVYKRLTADSRSRAGSALMAGSWCLALALLFGVAALLTRSTGISTVRALIAAGGGLCLFLASFLLLEAMKTNTLSVSVIIMNLNFVVTVALSALVLRERVSWLQLAGMLVSVAAILLLNFKGDVKGSPAGAVFVPLLASAANGILNFCIKCGSSAAEATGLTGQFAFFAVLYFTAALAAGGTALVLARRRRSDAPGSETPPQAAKTQLFPAKVWPFLALMGVLSGACFFTEALLAGRINAAALFTVLTSASIILSVTVGLLFQKERFTWKVAVSLVFCAVAILCQTGAIIAAGG